MCVLVWSPPLLNIFSPCLEIIQCAHRLFVQMNHLFELPYTTGFVIECGELLGGGEKWTWVSVNVRREEKKTKWKWRLKCVINVCQFYFEDVICF